MPRFDAGGMTFLASSARDNGADRLGGVRRDAGPGGADKPHTKPQNPPATWTMRILRVDSSTFRTGTDTPAPPAGREFFAAAIMPALNGLTGLFHVPEVDESFYYAVCAHMACRRPSP